MNDPRARQLSLNATSHPLWDAFAGHRRKVTELLTGGAEPSRSRLCVLGAGNCNDLDLPALLAAHREVHLVDLEAEALNRGSERQGVAGDPNLQRHGGVDVTGVIDSVAEWTPRGTVHPETIAAMAEDPARRVAAALPGPFDLVASTCLLTQIIGAAFHPVGAAHPQFLALVRATRTGHLRLITALTAPGGRAILITDITSSDALPALATLSEASLPGLLPALARDRNFFHGVNPAVLQSLFREDPILAARASELETIPPWRWDLRFRLYLVWALRFRLGTATG
jgi:hypothetical protein